MAADPLRIAFIFGTAAAVKEVLRYFWRRSKRNRKEIPMKLRKGTYVPWGWHERTVHYTGYLFLVWISSIVLMLTYRQLF
jgi:hypothetical protein